MAGAATDGDVMGARGSSASGPMAGSDGLTVYASTRVNQRTSGSETAIHAPFDFDERPNQRYS